MSRNIPIVLCGQKGSGCSEVANNLRIKSENSKILNEEELIRLTAARLGISFSDLFRCLKKGSIEYDKTLIDTLHEYTDSKTIIEGKYACRAIDKPSYRIFLTASDHQRIQHISKKWKIPFQQAHEQMKKSDKKRNKIVKQISGREWLDSSLYDLTLDTDNTTFGQIADTILHFIRSTDKKAVNLEDKTNKPQLLSYFHKNKLKKYLKKISLSNKTYKYLIEPNREYDNENDYGLSIGNKIKPHITDGPSIELLTTNAAVISWDTNIPTEGAVEVNGKKFNSKIKDVHHEAPIDELTPNTKYPCDVIINNKKHVRKNLKTMKRMPTFN